MPLSGKIKRKMERWVVLTHRWVGVVVCLMFVIWFVSGLVMLYVTYPKLTEEERMAGLTAIDWQQVSVGPATALANANIDKFPRAMRLEMSPHQPVYRIVGWDGHETTVGARDGKVVKGIDRQQALQVAKDFARARTGDWQAEVVIDQWTFDAALDPVRPLHRIALGDEAGRELYVSARTGAVVMDTTRQERVWNWLGVIPHIISVDQVRARPAIWRMILLWITIPSAVTAVLGLWLGITRLRVLKCYPRGAMSPFRGFLKWHHLLGVVGGVSLLVWIVAAVIYLRPGGLLQRVPIPAEAMRNYAAAPNGSRFPIALTRLAAAAPTDTRVVKFSFLGGRPWAFVIPASGALVAIDAQTSEVSDVPESLIVASVGSLMPGYQVTRATLLTQPDEHWHTFKLSIRKLPVLRIEFDDPRKHWFHIDPATGEVINTRSSGDRAFRWLFNGLHKLDFLFLLEREWLRLILVWALMLAGLGLSATGVVVGWRRLQAPR